MREIDSDCCCSISKQLARSPLPVGAPHIRLCNLANKKSSPTLSLRNFSASVVETVICCQNSRLYDVILSYSYFCVQDVMTDASSDSDAQAHQDLHCYLCEKCQIFIYCSNSFYSFHMYDTVSRQFLDAAAYAGKGACQN